MSKNYDILYGSNHQICNKAISDSTLSKHMRDKELAGVPHGFRSTLRTWLTDNTDIPFEVAEMIIAHQTGSKVARAYNRTDYLEQRRPYMEMWADFLDQGYKNVCS